ncbi:hypothetical protein ACFLVX_03660 [Chloroflexota bacterium]
MQSIWQYIQEHPTETLVAAILAIIFAIICAFFAGGIIEGIKYFISNRRLKRNVLEKYYEFIWKISSEIVPADLLISRPHKAYYYKRDEDILVVEKLSKMQNVLIKGPPLSGKSRAVYEALRNLNNPCPVIKPRCIDFDMGDFVFPGLKSGISAIIIIDDFQRFVEQKNFERLFQFAQE